MTNLILAAIAALVVGIVIGVFVGRSGRERRFGSAGRNSRLRN